MKQKMLFATVLLGITTTFYSCEKWKDAPAKDLGLTNKYCNIPSAINYNVGFPGIVDNSVCILPTTPFIGRYSYRDSVYSLANDLTLGDSINFEISAIDSLRFLLSKWCSNSNSMRFVANRFYRAEADSLIGAGLQLLCRDVDTLSGRLEYRVSDSSLYLELTVVSDTSISYHKGRAYKK